MQIDPQHKSLTYTNLGFFSEYFGNSEQASNYYRRALGIDSTLTEPYINIANIYDSEGKVDSAIVFVKRAVQLDPKNVFARRNYAAYMYEKGDTLKAIQEYHKAIQLDPEYPDSYFNLGEIYSEQGKYSEALRSFQKATQVSPNLVAAYVAQARINSLLGHTDKAYELLNEHVNEIKKEDPLSPFSWKGGTGLASFVLKSDEFQKLRTDPRWPDLRKKLVQNDHQFMGLVLLISFVLLIMMVLLFRKYRVKTKKFIKTLFRQKHIISRES